MIKKITALFLAVLMCLLVLSSCSKNVMDIDGEAKVSTYEIEFFMSRMKGTLYNYGYNVTSGAFWGTIMNSEGLTVDEYYKTQVMKQVSQYMIADYLFEKEGLSLSKDEKKEIGRTMDMLIDAAGSKNEFNATLAEFGINADMLEEIYIRELKMQKIKEHYFGSDGLSGEGSAEKKQEYVEDNYVCFKQVFLASYYYECESDKNGDTVYYTDEKAEHIAYDRENGVTREDIYNAGVLEKDEFGDVAYYTADGKIAYDTKGVTKFKLDKDGEKIVAFHTEERIDEIGEFAEEISKDSMSEAEFEALIEEYGEGDYGNKKQYLKAQAGYYESLSSVSAYLDEIADALSEMKDGESRVIDSGAGFHIVYKYEHDKGAYEEKENKEVFATLDTDFVNFLFEEKCEGYEELINIDDKLRDELPSMREVGVNILY